MKFEELSSKAKSCAMEQVTSKLKSHKDQYKVFNIAEVEKYISKNNLNFNKDGKLQ